MPLFGGGHMLIAMRVLNRGLTRLSCLMVLVVVVLMPAIALAQEVPPAVTLRRHPPVWLGYLVMFVLMAIVIVVSLMPSKRSHQD